MLEKLKKIYLNMPLPLSNFLIKLLNLNPYYSIKTWTKVDDIEKKYNETLNLNKKLKEVFDQVKNISFYDYIEENNLKLENFKNINLIDSEKLRENLEKIVDLKNSGYYTSTGGSGRKPSKLYLSNESYQKDIEHVIWAWSKIGYRKDVKKLTLRGIDLGSNLFKYNPIYNELQINIFMMNNENIQEILNEIKKFNPTFGHGYPSAFVKISQLLKNKKVELELSGISLASENFNEIQREIIEKTFKCPARGFFGHSERACFAAEKKEEPGIYEVALTYGLIEILDKNGESCKIGEEGEIVCTGFINKGMPLIRYKTGDYATVNKIKNDVVIEIKNIKGRWGKDFIYDKNRNSLPTTAINIHSKLQYEFKYIQLYQKEYGEVFIKLVPWNIEEFEDIKVEKVVQEFSQKIPNIKIWGKVVEENEIYKSHRGKIPYLVNELKQQEII